MFRHRLNNLGRHCLMLVSTRWGMAGSAVVAIWVVVAAAGGPRPVRVFLVVAAVTAFVVSSQRLSAGRQLASLRQEAEPANQKTAPGEIVRPSPELSELQLLKVAPDAQVLLRMHYSELARRGSPLPAFSDVEFRCRSQNGEDGILLYIFGLLGTTNRRVVEICAGDGLECNAANLMTAHGWQALLIDGDPANVARGRAFYSTCPDTWVAPPVMEHAWITADNVNDVVSRRGFAGPIDLLSLDIDGNDYWIWKALDCIEPRVVVLEFNASCGPERSVTMAYRPDYRLDLTSMPYRCGASLPAFVKLAKSKGYRLVGVQSLGFNAFFIRNGLGDDLLPERTPRECFDRNERLRQWDEGWLQTILSGAETWVDV
jgi:hypothetical protein